MATGVGMGYVPPDFGRPGAPIEIEIRGKHAPAVVVSKPIYHKPA
jgi:glycine cleavage system aminomethyltransferase T